MKTVTQSLIIHWNWGHPFQTNTVFKKSESFFGTQSVTFCGGKLSAYPQVAGVARKLLCQQWAFISESTTGRASTRRHIMAHLFTILGSNEIHQALYILIGAQVPWGSSTRDLNSKDVSNPSLNIQCIHSAVTLVTYH